MTSHVHLIIGTNGNPLQNIMRDLKRHTSEVLHKSIENNHSESRKEWIIWMMERAAKKNNNSSKFRLWQPESHPIQLINIQMAHQKLEDSQQGNRTKQNGTKILKGTSRKLEITCQTLSDFSELKKFPLKIKLIKKTNKREVASQKIYWNKFYQKFSDYLYNDLNCYDNYTGSVIKDVRTFFNYLAIEKNLSIGNFHKKFYVYKEDIEIITLQPEQLNYLINDKPFENSLPPKLLQIKDIFVVGCTVALRYSDLMNMKPSNLEKENNQYYLKIQSKKTKVYTRIKFPEYAVQIFLKYKNNKKRLLPYFNLTRLNIYLKRLSEQAGWVEEKIKRRQKRGIAIIVYKNKKKKVH